MNPKENNEDDQTKFSKWISLIRTALGGKEDPVKISDEKGEAKSLESASHSESEGIKTLSRDSEAMSWKYASGSLVISQDGSDKDKKTGIQMEKNLQNPENQMELNVSKELATIIGTGKGEKITRPRVVKRLWAYLKEHNLQDPENKQFFTPDATMEPVFGNERMKSFSMSKYLKEHLTKPDE